MDSIIYLSIYTKKKVDRFLDNLIDTSNRLTCTQDIFSFISSIENQKIFVFVISNVLKNIRVILYSWLSFQNNTFNMAQRRSSPKQCPLKVD